MRAFFIVGLSGMAMIGAIPPLHHSFTGAALPTYVWVQNPSLPVTIDGGPINVTIVTSDGGAFPVPLPVTPSDGGLFFEPPATATKETLPSASPITPTANTSTVIFNALSTRMSNPEICNVGTVVAYVARGTGATSSAYDVVLDPPQSAQARGDCWAPTGPGIWRGAITAYGALGIKIAAGGQ